MGLRTIYANCSHGLGNNSSSGFSAIIDPYSHNNQILVISVYILLLSILLFVFIYTFSSRKIVPIAKSLSISPLSIFSAILNGSLGLVYFGLAIWTVKKNSSREQSTVLPLHGWLGELLHGSTWLLLSLSLTLKKKLLPLISAVKLCAIIALLLAAFLCIASIGEATKNKFVTVVVLDISSFPGSILLLFCAFKGHKFSETEGDIGSKTFGTTRQGEEANVSGTINSKDIATPFDKAGFISRMSFWWLNPLLKMGKQKTLEDTDIPQLHPADQSETCYLHFVEQLSKQKRTKPSKSPSILLAILSYQWKAILVTGFFALIRTLTLSAGPLFLHGFIQVAQGKETFRYEGYALTAGLFISKCLESLSERQWYFGTKLIGLQVKSSLTAALYQKQLRLSNAAKKIHSPGQIMNYVTVDAHKIGEFPYWFHQIWTLSLQMCTALFIVYYSVGLATVVALGMIILTVLGNSPLGKLQLRYHKKLMVAQDTRVKATAEAFTNIKVLKLYAWETHFMNFIERLRKEETKWLLAVHLKKGYYVVYCQSSTILVSVATLGACYLLGIPFHASNVFTFLATLRIIMVPIRRFPDFLGAFIEAKTSFSRIVKFLDAPELHNRDIEQKYELKDPTKSILINSNTISWDNNCLKPTLRNICLEVKHGEKVAICGEVGSGKSTLIAVILGEVPYANGTVQVYGKIAYVSQTPWIQSGTIQENILFGSTLDLHRYQEVLEKCSLVKDLEMLPSGDLTDIGERGVNLSGGQKQRVQLARALYQDADVYLLDDPFSAVDAHTATSLFNEYVMGALSGKTVLLVTHQVEFLPVFDSILVMSEGEILRAGTYDQLMACCQEFLNLVNAHHEAAASERQGNYASPSKRPEATEGGIRKASTEGKLRASVVDQLIKAEEREAGDTGLRPYMQYVNHRKGFLYFFLSTLFYLWFIVGQLIQNYFFAADVDDSRFSKSTLITIYVVIGFSIILCVFFRSLSTVSLSHEASNSIFSTLMRSLFHAPMTFHDSTPMGRILSRVSSDLNTVDLTLPFQLNNTVATIMMAYFNFGILALLCWQILFIVIPVIYLIISLQRFYIASAKELMRISGTTKSLVANHLNETIAGSVTIRAFGEEGRFFSKTLELIDANARPFFYSFSATEWLLQRLEALCIIVLCSSTLSMTLLHQGASASGFVGMSLAYALSLTAFLEFSVQNQCMLASSIVSIERVEQYMHITSEGSEVIQGDQPAINWPVVGRVEICDLKVRYRPNTPLVLQGISCIFEGGHKIGIVGRTGCGKSTLISALFRLVEPTEGKIIIDDVDISTIGLHDLRAQIGIIPQDPILFTGSVRYNLDPLCKHTDQEIWEVLEKCQLKQAVQDKEAGLDSSVLQDGSNWSMGQRQLFCLGRVLLKRSRVLVLDEATASIDNATDSIIQKTIRTEFAGCTVLTVAHRIPTVMDSTMILAISDGKLAEYDEPKKLMQKEGSLFNELVKEYWSHTENAALPQQIDSETY